MRLIGRAQYINVLIQSNKKQSLLEIADRMSTRFAKLIPDDADIASS